MLSELLRALRGDGSLETTREKLQTLLAFGSSMLDVAWDTVSSGEASPEAAGDLAARFAEAHEAVRSIRKSVVTHLSVRPGHDVPSALILMSVVKDAETICRSALDLDAWARRREPGAALLPALKELHDGVSALFRLTGAALVTDDTDAARSAMAAQCRIAQRHDGLLKEALATAASASMLFVADRLNEIASRLGMIAASLVLPLDALDHYECELVLADKNAKGGSA